MEYGYKIKIPKERIAVLIGENGRVKKEIEVCTKSRLKIDSEEGDVSVSGNDSLQVFTASEIIKAIGRGFNPDTAMQLFDPECCFELIDIQSYAKSNNDVVRLKGRVIGKGGKSRETIERLSGTKISVFGKTIGIIGKAEEVLEAKRAIEKILRGSPHSKVYGFLERRRKEKNARGLLESEKVYK